MESKAWEQAMQEAMSESNLKDERHRTYGPRGKSEGVEILKAVWMLGWEAGLERNLASNYTTKFQQALRRSVKYS